MRYGPSRNTLQSIKETTYIVKNPKQIKISCLVNKDGVELFIERSPMVDIIAVDTTRKRSNLFISFNIPENIMPFYFPTIFKKSSSVIIRTPFSFAFSIFVPGFLPQTR